MILLNLFLNNERKNGRDPFVNDFGIFMIFGMIGMVELSIWGFLGYKLLVAFGV